MSHCTKTSFIITPHYIILCAHRNSDNLHNAAFIGYSGRAMADEQLIVVLHHLCALYKFIEELHGITDAERCRIDMPTSLPKLRAEKNTTENESHNTI